MARRETDSEIIYIFKSTWYPDFRQKILSLLSLPKDLTFVIEFDEKWLSSKIKSNLGNLEGKTAFVIFLDFASQRLRFHPLRICKIVRILPPTDGVTYQVILSMGDFAIPINLEEFNSKTRGFLEEAGVLKKDEAGNENVTNLVISGDRSVVDLSSPGSNQQKVWEQIVDHLAEVGSIGRKRDQPQFANSVFFRINILPRKELRTPLAPEDHLYKFGQGNQYSLTFSVYNPHSEKDNSKGFQRTIVEYDPKLVAHVGSEQIDLPLGQRTFTKYFDFRTKEPLTGGESELVIKGKEDNFETPFVQIRYILLSKRGEMIAMAFCLAWGILILGIAGTLPDNIVIWANLKQANAALIIQIALVLIGTILSAVPIVWLEIKRR